MIVGCTTGPGGTFIGGAALETGCLYLGLTNTMILAGFSASALIMQSVESCGMFALRRHRAKFGGTQPKLAFDRERL